MSFIALTAVLLLWYALQNLYTDYIDQKKRGNMRKGIELARQRQVMTFSPTSAACLLYFIFPLPFLVTWPCAPLLYADDECRSLQLEAEVKKNAKWQAREEENRKATEAKRKEAEEKERKRVEAMREAAADKERSVFGHICRCRLQHSDSSVFAGKHWPSRGRRQQPGPPQRPLKPRLRRAPRPRRRLLLCLLQASRLG